MLRIDIDACIGCGVCEEECTFDAIEVAGTASRLAEFTDVNGNTGAYPYAAPVAPAVAQAPVAPAAPTTTK